MEVIKRKIAALKDDLGNKEELISELQNSLKNEKLEREKAENEASSFKRKVNYLIVLAGLVRGLRPELKIDFRSNFWKKILIEPMKIHPDFHQNFNSWKKNGKKLNILYEH